MAEQEIILRANPMKTVRDAAMEAKEKFPLNQPDKHAKEMMEAWAGMLKIQTDQLTKDATWKVKMKNSEVAPAGAGPINPTTPLYPWWNILIAGPYQPAPAGGGPYLPHKIFRPAEDAFCLGAVWLNPAPINWFPPGPSAADVMNAFNLRINFHTINLVTVQVGQAPAPMNMNPLAAFSFLGLPWLKLFEIRLGPGVFPNPLQGQPQLFEMNVTADVTGPAPEPFAGFCTWVFDPDSEPWPPMLPGMGPHWQFEIPVRFMTYTL